jgi:hypothetical protein
MLGVCVGDNEFDAFETGIDHVVDRVPAGAADSENNDPRLEIRGLRTHQRERHFVPTLSDPAPADRCETPPFRIGYEQVKETPVLLKRELPDRVSRRWRDDFH